MQIDSEVLNHLNQEQLKFSAEFLRHVFVDNKTYNQPLSQLEIDTVRSIFLAVPTTEMKLNLLNGLNHQNQFSLIAGLTDTQVDQLFDYYDNLIVLKSVIKTINESRLKVILQKLYQNNKEKYHELKQALDQTISIVEGVIITKSSELNLLIEADIERLIKAFLSPKLVIKQMNQLSKRIEKKYEKEQLETLVSTLIEQFNHLKIGLRNAQEFSNHLKFYQFLFPFFRLYPNLTERLKINIHQLILSLHQLPNLNWVFKVLDQLPVPVIEMVIKQLRLHERIREFEKRNIYCKLLKNIEENLKRSSAENVKQAFSLK